MRLTIRGWAVIAIIAASVAMAWQYGPRALNAVVTPLVVVIVAGLVTTIRATRPEIRRASVPEGFVGEERTVEVTIESDSAVSATVRDTVGDGLSVLVVETASTDADNDHDPIGRTTLEGDDRFGYEIRLEERGAHRLGPLTITISDVFGLVTRRFRYEETTTVLVYPRVHDLQAGPGRELQAFVDGDGQDREEFDHLREYQRGDSLRDVHWKSAAKRPDTELVVTEYTTDEAVGSATVAAECQPGWDDELATAVASVTTHLLERDIDVGVVLPDSDHAPGAGQEHRSKLLAQFAVLESGDLDERHRQAADVLVQADADGTRVSFNGRQLPFDQLTSDHDWSEEHGQVPRDRPGSDESGVAP